MGGSTAFWDMMTCPLISFSDHNRLSGFKLARRNTPFSQYDHTSVDCFLGVVLVIKICGQLLGLTTNPSGF